MSGDQDDGERLALIEWSRHGRGLIVDKRIYKKTVPSIKCPEIRSTFDQKLARLASDSRMIFCPEPQKRTRRWGRNS
jgi:hypothetical protein